MPKLALDYKAQLIEHSVAHKFGDEPADRLGHGAVIRAYVAEVFGIEAR
jgi:hypothetical protein